VPGSSRVGRAEYACGSNRFRSACGVDGRGARGLLRDGSLREPSNRARAAVADRPGLSSRFVDYGLALRELKDEKEQTEGRETAPRGRLIDSNGRSGRLAKCFCERRLRWRAPPADDSGEWSPRIRLTCAAPDGRVHHDRPLVSAGR
jgi:hypothetical protein